MSDLDPYQHGLANGRTAATLEGLARSLDEIRASQHTFQEDMRADVQRRTDRLPCAQHTEAIADARGRLRIQWWLHTAELGLLLFLAIRSVL